MNEGLRETLRNVKLRKKRLTMFFKKGNVYLRPGPEEDKLFTRDAFRKSSFGLEVDMKGKKPPHL